MIFSKNSNETNILNKKAKKNRNMRIKEGLNVDEIRRIDECKRNKNIKLFQTALIKDIIIKRWLIKFKYIQTK